MKPRWIVTLSLAVVLGTSGTAAADAFFGFSGTTVGGPRWIPPVGSPPSNPCFATECPSSLKATVPTSGYQATRINVNQTTTCVAQSVQEGDGYLFVYRNSFDPGDPGKNLVAFDDNGDLGSGTSIVGFTAEGNVPYVVLTSDTVAGPSGAFVGLVSCNSPSPSAPAVISGGCGPADGTRACLNNGRFEVTAVWTDRAGQQRPAGVVPFAAADSAIFYFFDANIWEMLVKVVNFCPAAYTVFASATTDLGVQITVRDTATGQTGTIVNPLGAKFSYRDQPLLGTCP